MKPSGSRVFVSGVGSELPPRRVTTAEVEEWAGIGRFGFEPGWLERVTGVRERRWAEPDVNPSDLAAAAKKALADADADPLSVDVVIFAGITRDFIEPAVANVVSEQLGTRRARIFDVGNACNGLIDALDVADALISSGKAGRVLVTSGERSSISINWWAETVDELASMLTGLPLAEHGAGVALSSRSLLKRTAIGPELRTIAERLGANGTGRTRSSPTRSSLQAMAPTAGSVRSRTSRLPRNRSAGWGTRHPFASSASDEKCRVRSWGRTVDIR
jgi:3-oxoacyl-[acyl-carrier-protein] synthase III